VVGDECDVRILERRLARRHAAEPDTVELRHDRLRHLGDPRLKLRRYEVVQRDDTVYVIA